MNEKLNEKRYSIDNKDTRLNENTRDSISGIDTEYAAINKSYDVL